jgi:hypothetical protein
VQTSDEVHNQYFCDDRNLGTDQNNRNALPKHPYEVMIYAAKHDYDQMVAEAAPLLLDQPLNEMIQKLPGNMAMPWVRRVLQLWLVLFTTLGFAAGSVL